MRWRFSAGGVRGRAVAPATSRSVAQRFLRLARLACCGLLTFVALCAAPRASAADPTVDESTVNRSTGDKSRADGILQPLHATINLPLEVESIQGFTMQLRVGRQTTAGYVPVEIRVKSATRFSTDRRLVVSFRGESQLESPPQNGLTVDVPIVVNQGSSVESFIRYLPKWSAGQAVTVSVSEAGRPLDGYETFLGVESLMQTGSTRARRGTHMQRYLISDEYTFNWLFLSGDDEPDPASLPDLLGLFHSPQTGHVFGIGTLGGATPQDVARFWSEMQSGPLPLLNPIGQKGLPHDWRAYQRYDVIIMEPEGLRRLRDQGVAYEAVRDWILNGGTVIVYDVDAVARAMESLGFSEAVDAKSTELLGVIDYELTAARQLERLQAQKELEHIESLLLEVRESAESTGQNTDGQSSLDLSASADFPDPRIQDFLDEMAVQQRLLDQLDETLRMSSAVRHNGIQVAGVGAGYVMSVQLFGGHETPTAAQWTTITKFLDFRASPTLRRGVDPLLGDGRFGRWTIPGVAQPPVYTFMGLLVVFVILVGPVAYRQTSKRGRSYLMFAIAPALALLTTVAMFGYGIVSDGFGTVVRVRQLTWVDGKTGHAGERIRSTYFAGVRPSAGLRFPGNAELMVYHEGSGQSWDELERRPDARLGDVVVEADSQHLDSSFLPSRQQRQFVVHMPRRNVGSLQLVLDPQGNRSAQITNGLSFPIRQAVLRDERSDYWLVEKLAANEVGPGTPLSNIGASKLLGKLYSDHQPLTEVRETRSTRNRYDLDIFDVILDTNRRLGRQTSITDGIFEAWLQQHLLTNPDLPDEHFVAVADISPDVIVIEGSEVSSSVRYVFGTLR